jgi:hypothetical protein
MLLDTIATILLMGMMLVPVLNVVVGAVAGAALAGPIGAVTGFLISATILLAQHQLLGQRRAEYKFPI